MATPLRPVKGGTIRNLVRATISSPVAQALIRLAYPHGARRRIRRGPLRGRTIVIGLNMGVSYIWNLDGPNWAWAHNLVRPGDVVYDVGAHLGESTLHLATSVGPTGKVFAFEPVPHSFRTMSANVASLPQVVPVEAAASDQDGTGEFVVDASQAPLSRLGGGKTWDLPLQGSSISVKVMRLDSYRDRGWPPPTFLKVDVEGGAGAVLAGAEELLSTHRPRLYVELHDRAEQAAVREALLRHRYRATSAKNGTVEDLQERWASPVYCEPL